MNKITDQDPISKSADILQGNIQKLKSLFPEIITEGSEGTAINVDVLKSLVGDRTVTDADEKYGLTWHGKRKARQLALTPSTGTLRPAPEDSVDWDTTKNLMIEGDNLEVLKLLQKSYAGKIKMIYIDPPYNTGKDFVYKDDFRDNISNYLEVTGQKEGDRKLSTNTESSGRYHTDWLNMMYPRLKLAHSLLKDDGVIFISIDDNEVSNIITLCNEIFGEEHLLNTVAVKMSEPTGVKMTHVEKRLPKLKEYIVIYTKGTISINPPKIRKDNWDNEYKHLIIGPSKSDLERLKELMDADSISEDEIVEADGISNKINLVSVDSLYNDEMSEEDKEELKYSNAFRIVRDVATTGKAKDLADEKKLTTNSPFFIIKTPQNKVYLIKRDYNDEAEQPRIKMLFADKYLTTNVGDFWQDIKTTGLDNEGGIEFRNGKKPLKMIERTINMCSNKEDIILDFFAGSGTVGHAVYNINSSNDENRRYILVQLPEVLNRNVIDHQEAINQCDSIGKALNIAELTKERLRRAGNKIREENPLFAGDLGFRVFKLDSSNILEWDINSENLEESLQMSIDHLKSDRSEDDILYEILLKLGLDLCVPMEKKVIGGKTVHSVGGGVLMACLDKQIAREDVETLALGMIDWHEELAPEADTTVIFRDSAFKDDIAKTNLSAILEQYGIKNVRSL